MKKKKLIIGSVSGVLAVVLVFGGISYAMKRSAAPVKVASVSSMNNSYWNDSSDISPYGNVTTNLNQNINYDSSLTITQIYVSEGDTVKVGDPLIAYDTTLVSMELEMKQMEIDGLGLSIQNVQAELDQLRKTKPVASVTPNVLSGLRLTAAGTESGGVHLLRTVSTGTAVPQTSSGSEPAAASETIDPAKVYTKITAESVPYKGTGTETDPYRFYVCPAESGKAVSVAKDYLKKAVEEKSYAVFDTVDDLQAPTKIVSSWEMNWNEIAELIDQNQSSIGSALTEAQKTAIANGLLHTASMPLDADAVENHYAGSGTAADPYRYLCEPGISADTDFLRWIMESRAVCRFEVVKDDLMLYTWTLDGSAGEPEDPDNPDDPDTPDDPDDPGIDIPDDPGIDIPSGPTKDELAQQIREKEESLKDLDLQKRTSELALKQLKQKMDDGLIKSTVNGTVKSVVDEETAKLENTPLISVVGEEGYYITGYVAETALGLVQKDMTVTATSWNDGMSYEATITSVSGTPSDSNYYGGSNPNMSYYPFTAVIKGDADLNNGDGVDLSLDGISSGDTSQNGDIYLSNAFVREDGNRSYVYKKGDNGKLVKQYVETGKIMYGSVEIKSGLDMEDEIAFPYGKNVKDGAKTETVDSLYDYGY